MIGGLASLVVLFWGLLLWLGRVGKRERKRMEAEMAPLLALPIQAARQDAEALLSAGSPFELDPDPVAPQRCLRPCATSSPGSAPSASASRAWIAAS
jgi:hypothetical protein